MPSPPDFGTRTRPTARRRLALAVALCATLVVAVQGTLLRGSADQITDKIGTDQQQRKHIGGIIDQLNTQIASLTNQEAQLRLQIQVLDDQIAQQEQRISDQQARLDQIAVDLAAAQRHLVQARARLGSDRDALAREIVAIYKMGDNSAIDDLLASDNFNEFWQHLIDLRRVAGAENDVVDNVRVEAQAVEQDIARINSEQAEQTRILGDMRAEQARLVGEQQKRQVLKQQLDQTIASDNQQRAQAEQSARELDAQIASLKAQEAAIQAEIAAEEAAARARGGIVGGGNGQFAWPEQGPISQYFGCTSYPAEPYDPNCPTRHFHTGIDIADSWGTPIGAGATGVAFVYYSSYGYGDHVIIDHGNGFVTVYGHMSRFAVSNGQVVVRGQLIGYEGSTGNSSGPHLHFEIRLNGTPVNPLRYLS
jgi:murein DD-endopeptidase MepM/ murein hydrolase activator NlpD